MHKRVIVLTLAAGLVLLAQGSPVAAQVTGGVLYVNNTHMS
jgi:hypothetical protein